MYARTPVKTNVSLSGKNLELSEQKIFYAIVLPRVLIWLYKTVFSDQLLKDFDETHKCVLESMNKCTCYKNCQHIWFKGNLISKKRKL